MSIRSMAVLITLVISTLIELPDLRAQERKISKAQLPAAVQKTVDEQSKDATIRGFSTEVEQGHRVYEVELRVNGHSRDVAMDEQGNVVEVEEELSIDSLPPAVRDGLTRAAASGTIVKVESITKKGKLMAYEAVVKMGTKRSEIQVGPDGHKLGHPE